MERSKRRITIVLEPKAGSISLSSFRTAIEQLTVLLNEVASELSEPKPRRISWGLVQLSLNSLAKISVEGVEEDTDAIAERTSSVVIQGLTELHKGRIRPKYFNDNALESAQKLARLTADGLARINVYTDLPDQQIYLEEQLAVNVSGILEFLDYYGSVEGKLELLSGSEGHPLFFRVQDRVNNVIVRCLIRDELLDDALSAFRKRVIVSGIIKSDNSGIPRTISVENIETIPESLPQPEDLIKPSEEDQFEIRAYGQES